ncbi:Endonuclease/reverse transcriptase protein, partial [Thalictrum thalictroides]
GLPRPPAPYSGNAAPLGSSSPFTNIANHQNNSKPRQHRTYASTAASRGPTPLNPAQVKNNLDKSQPKNKPSTKNNQEDNRLLVRVSTGHPALSMSPYAVLQQLNNYLKENLVREIQNIKTGFAICPASSTAQEKLHARMGEIESFLSTQGECKVEKPETYQAFRLSGVPRAFTGFNGSTMTSTEITEDMVSKALTELTNVVPVKTLPSQNILSNEFSAQRNWIVLYPKGLSLPRSLPLFGVRVSTKLLPKRSRTPQCGKCFGWHNERSCARSPRCRICSSSKHVENDHITCDPSRPHDCPPKCANCHGPHPADSLECLIRPRKDNTLPNKAQITQIRHAAAAARLRLKTAHCGTLGSKDTTPPPTSEDNLIPPSTSPQISSLFTKSPSPTRNGFQAQLGLDRGRTEDRMHEE